MILAAHTGDLLGAIDGHNVVFVAQVTLTANAVVYVNGLARLSNLLIDNGYTLTGQTLVLGEAPVVGDTVWIYQPDGQAGETVTNYAGPAPAQGQATAYRPYLGNIIQLPEGSVNPSLAPQISAGR